MIPEFRMERILFATDYLESSRLALDYAVAFAHQFKASIVMLHVVQLSQAAVEAELTSSRLSVSRSEAQDRLEVLAAGVRHTGLQVEAHIKDGDPCEEILKAVSVHRADLLVLGVHGVHRGVGHLLLGSNTEKLLLSSTCPTLTVGAHVLAGFSVPLHLREILYFSDFTAEAAAAASYAVLSEEHSTSRWMCVSCCHQSRRMILSFDGNWPTSTLTRSAERFQDGGRNGVPLPFTSSEA